MTTTLSDCIHSSTLELVHCCSSTLNGDPQFSTQNWVCILEFQNPTFTKLVSSFTSSVLAAGNPWAPPKHAWGHKLNMLVNPSQGSPISWKVLDWWFLLVHLHLLLISQEILYKRLYILFSVGFFLNGLLGLKKKHQTFSDKIHGIIFRVTSNWHSLCCCTFPSEQMVASSFCMLN